MVLANIILSTWHYIHVLAWMVLCIPDSWLQNEFPICDQQLNIHIMFEPLIKIMFLSYWLYCIPYSRKFSLVQIFAEICPNPSEEIFHSFYFCGTKVWCSDPTHTRWWPCPICTCNQRNDTERLSEASLCNNGLLFLLCRVLSNYKSIKTARRHGLKTGLLNRRFSTADLDFDNFRASLTGSLVPYTRVSKRIRLF